MSFSATQCVGVTQLVSVFLSEKIAPCVAVYLVCPWRRQIQEPPMLPSWSGVLFGGDNFKAYVLYCLPKFLSRIKHQLPTVVICLKMCPLLAKCPSLFSFPISLLAFSPSPNYIISTYILISESISKITQSKTPTLILSHTQTLDLNW